MEVASKMRHQIFYYIRRMGGFGDEKGQLNNPNGIAINARDEVIVTDSNNHRVQVFDKDGNFRLSFGNYGDEDGLFRFPNKVAVTKSHGDIIVTEQPPSEKVQVFTSSGMFLRKIDIGMLSSPRVLTVDDNDRVIILAYKKEFDKTILVIIHPDGEVISTHDLDITHATGVVSNGTEIFVADYKLSFISVFDYNGTRLREIGDPNVLKNVIGVCISSTGTLIVSDTKDNYFRVTMFDQAGTLVSGFVSVRKHFMGGFDVAILNEYLVVFGSREDCKLFVYRIDAATLL